VDKPAGITSHDVVSAARRIFGQRQVGHAGTLDPLATGLLPLLLGQGTKLSAWTTADDKTYETTARLGQRTDTLDAEGVVEKEVPIPQTLAPEALEASLAPLRGSITQQVPAYSAVKVDGRRLYQRARAGEDVEAPTRRVLIHELCSLGYAPPHLALRVSCSKGTYIRQLVADVGEALGCGAHVASLRRTRVGALEVADAVTLEALQASADPAIHLVPLRTWLAHRLPAVTCDAETAARIRQGQRLPWSRLGVEPMVPGTRFVLVTADELVAVAEVPAGAAGSTAQGAGSVDPRTPYRLLRVFPAT
jgi:tRNA pseudouridine55 synthase